MHPILNAANFNAIGAALLSVALGSSVGSLLFFFAALIGTINKLDFSTYAAPSRYSKVFRTPAFTAIILTLASFWNCIDALLELLNVHAASERSVAVALSLTLAWGAGFIGDAILVLLETINYPRVSANQVIPGWQKALRRLSSVLYNPAIMYSAALLGFILSAILNTEVNQSFSFYTTGLLALIATTLAIICSFTRMLVSNRIITMNRPSSILELLIADYSCNYLLALGTFLLMLAAFCGGQLVVATAQLFFLAASFSLISESRAAQKATSNAL
jgi:hypothetical protein